MSRLESYVLNSLAFGHARSAVDVADRLRRARVTARDEDVEECLLGLLDEAKVEQVGQRWRRA